MDPRKLGSVVDPRASSLRSRAGGLFARALIAFGVAFRQALTAWTASGGQRVRGTIVRDERF